MSEQLDLVTDALSAAGMKGNRNSWCCPSHDDSSPSLSVTDGIKGVVMKCHAGCEVPDILAAIGLIGADLFYEALTPEEQIRYPYTDEDGKLLFTKIRKPGKKFLNQAADGQWKLDGIRKVLYNLPALVRAQGIVYVVEGERDADTLIRLGHVATTNFDGAGKWRQEYNQFFAGREVIILGDNDKAGLDHITLVEKNLTPVAKSVVTRVSPVGKDVTDLISSGHDLSEIVALDEPVEYHLTDKAVRELTDDKGYINWDAAFEAQPETVPWLVEPLLEDNRTHCLWGEPGSGKSLFVLETVVNHILPQGKTVLLIDNENILVEIVDRLKAFGCTPASLKNLRLRSFTDLPPLNTRPGGDEVLRLAQESGACLVIIDTTSRFIDGDENSSTPYLDFYRNTLAILKMEGIASLRLDHPGKDPSKGARGTSAKYGDVDFEFRITDEGITRKLTCTKNRTSHGLRKDQFITLRKHGISDDNPSFYHEWDYRVSEQDRQLIADMKILDEVNVPQNAGSPSARTYLTNAGIKMSNPRIEAAVRERKKIVKLPPTSPETLAGIA